jgi:hypothetical protein
VAFLEAVRIRPEFVDEFFQGFSASILSSASQCRCTCSFGRSGMSWIGQTMIWRKCRTMI